MATHATLNSSEFQSGAMAAGFAQNMTEKEVTSMVFPGLTKAEEVVVLSAIVVASLAVLAVLLRFAMPLLRKKKVEKADNDSGSSTWSGDGSVGPDPVNEKEGYVTNIIWSEKSASSGLPTLSRLDSLNLQEMYYENWRNTSVRRKSITYPPQ